MTDLTEQWKKGELPEGFYWVKVKEEIANYPILADCVRRYEYYDVYTYFPEYEDSITSVLAPVPSYDEWLEKTKSLKVLAEAYCKEKQKNTKLKEVLKEYKDITAIAMLYAKSDEEYKQAKTVREQIDEVLK